MPEEQRRVGGHGYVALQGRQLDAALEGDEGAVRGLLYEKIAADPRQGGEITLQEGFAEGRQFPNWSMGFRDLDSPEARSDPGYSEFLNAPLTGREFSGDPSRAQKLLITFKRTM